MLRIRQGIFLSLVKLYRLDRNCQSTNGYRFDREIFYIDANELYTHYFVMHIVLQLCYILCNRMTSMLYPLISRSYNMQSIFKFLYSDN